MPATAPRRLDDRARSELRFVRDAIARTSQFSAVPGWGGVAMGALALAAAPLAHRQATPRSWLAVWLATAVVGFAIGVATLVRKATRGGVELTRQPARGFALALLPPLGAGALLSAAWVRAGIYTALPGTWLLLYGTAVITAGAYSVRVLPLFGGALVGLGTLALLLPDFGDLGMAIGFGLLHVVSGLYVARRHGG
jgi:hypothetical protein